MSLSILQLAGVLLMAGCVAPVVVPPKPEVTVFPSPPDEPRFYFERTIFSSADVAKEDSGGDLRRMLTGETLKGEGLGKPYGVAAYKGRIFVSDAAVHAVVVFDIPGQRYFKIGEGDVGQLTSPMGLDVDGKGQLYVVDSSQKQVQVYDKDGKYLRTIGEKMFLKPTGIAVDAAGERIYVVDTGGIASSEHRVRVFDAQSGAHLLDIGKRGADKGELNLPRDVTIGPDGLLYVVDGGNFRVQVFKPDGTFVRLFGEVGRQGGQFSRPKEAAIDPDGNVYVVDSAFGNFQIFTSDGKLLLAIGSRSEKGGVAKYLLPSGIAIDGDGRVYVVDQFFRKIDVYRPAGLAVDGGFALRRETAPKK